MGKIQACISTNGANDIIHIACYGCLYVFMCFVLCGVENVCVYMQITLGLERNLICRIAYEHSAWIWSQWNSACVSVWTMNVNLNRNQHFTITRNNLNLFSFLFCVGTLNVFSNLICAYRVHTMCLWVFFTQLFQLVSFSSSSLSTSCFSTPLKSQQNYNNCIQSIIKVLNDILWGMRIQCKHTQCTNGCKKK